MSDARSPASLLPAAGLRGDKVLLRRFLAADIDERYLAWLHDAEVLRYSNQRFCRHDTASCEAYRRSFEGSENLFLSVHSLDDRRPVGTMTAYVALPHAVADVGIMIGDRSVWGRGLGLDAWRTLIGWLLGPGGMRKVTAGTLVCNRAMLALMQRSGMHHEATRKDQEIVDGVPVDIHYYARFAAA